VSTLQLSICFDVITYEKRCKSGYGISGDATALENRISIAAANVSGNNIYKGKSIFIDFDYDNKTEIVLPMLRVGSSANEQISTIDVDLKRIRRVHKKRFEGLSNNPIPLI
jgi:hypothetical protein